ncbi:hypothetical protein ACIBSV_23510 [Embleya sp. NPDC050154]|uniref:hypothetical protein n=1 Tax=Embleya sp. NPDC050154 TaxID=3363988 RepID=UPI00378E6518
MAQTSTVKPKKPPIRRESPDTEPEAFPAATAPAVPIEVTVTREPDSAAPAVRADKRVRVLPIATLAAEAATTSGAGLYAAVGVMGPVGLAGAVTAAAVATRAARSARERKTRGGPGARFPMPGRSGIARGAPAGRVPGGGHSGGAANGRTAGAPGRTSTRRSSGAKSGAGLPGGKSGGRSGARSAMAGGPSGGGFRAGLGAGNAAHRLGRGTSAGGGSMTNGRTRAGRPGGAAGPKGSGTGGASTKADRNATPGSAKGAGSRSGRSGGAATGSRSGKGPGGAVRGALKSTRGAVHKAATSKAGRMARERASQARAGARRVAPKVARAVGAGLAALGSGALAGTAGLAASVLGAGLGGALRWATGRGPGASLGKGPLMWGPRAGAWAWRRLMRKFRSEVEGSSDRVLTDFPEPTDVASATSAPVLAGGAESTGVVPMSIFAVRSEAIRDAYARYSPPTMMAVAAEYQGVPDGIRSAAKALYELATHTANEYPVHPQLAETLSSVFALTTEAAKTADEIEPAFAKLHAADLARHETPRNGEAMWNIGERRAHGDSRYRRSHFAASCEDIETAYSWWAPTNMIAVGAEYEGLPTGLESLAAAVRYLAEQSAEAYPVDERIAGMIADTHTFLTSAIGAAQELHPLFRRLHALDISHHEAPRNGPMAESMWDV